MKRKLYRFILNPIKAYLREDIESYTRLIKEYEELRCYKFDKNYDKEIDILKIKRAETLRILNHLCVY